ncbi:MAG: o-succinylbenzoate synthase [Stackebrandtia sp.]
MRIAAAELRRADIPLVAPFRTSFGVDTVRHVLLMRVVAESGAEGWGECVADAQPRYSSEHVAGAADVIERFFTPALTTTPQLRAWDVAPRLGGFKGHPMAKAAVEAAVLDAELRERGMPLADFLGARAEAVPSGVSVGIMDSIGALLDAVAGYLDAGYLRIKLKIEPGWDVAPVRAVREEFGDSLDLQVDANAAYRLGDARHLTRLDPFDLLLIEQPLPEDDLRGHAELARLLRTPVCLDESITSAKIAADAIAMQATSIVNIKPGRVGGYLEARRIHDVCAAHGVPVWCGGMLETGVGRAANLALAALPNFTLPGDTSASNRYYARDLAGPFVLENGHIRVPTGPGIGVTPDADALKEFTVETRQIAC